LNMHKYVCFWTRKRKIGSGLHAKGQVLQKLANGFDFDEDSDLLKGGPEPAALPKATNIFLIQSGSMVKTKNQPTLIPYRRYVACDYHCICRLAGTAMVAISFYMLKLVFNSLVYTKHI